MPNCLVIIDVQKGFITPRTKHVVPRITELAGSGYYNHVVATRFQNVPDGPYERFLGWDGFMDEASQEIAPDVMRFVERVFVKYTYTCFTTEFDDYIRRNGIDCLYMCGVDTDACVLKSAIDAFERNIECKVIVDCCASDGDSEVHEAAVCILERTIGESQLIHS